MNLAAAFLTGLLAGGVSCAAVQGGLLTGLITRQHAAAATEPTRSTRDTRPSPRTQLADDLAPVGGFLAGKLVSHAILGALLGTWAAARPLPTPPRPPSPAGGKPS